MPKSPKKKIAKFCQFVHLVKQLNLNLSNCFKIFKIKCDILYLLCELSKILHLSHNWQP